MDHTRPAPSHRLFSGLAEVVQPTLAQKIDRSVGQRGPHICGHYINEGPKLSLALPELFLCSLPVIDVDTRTMPFDKFSISIESRHFSVQHPPIDTIGSSHS